MADSEFGKKRRVRMVSAVDEEPDAAIWKELGGSAWQLQRASAVWFCQLLVGVTLGANCSSLPLFAVAAWLIMWAAAGAMDAREKLPVRVGFVCGAVFLVTGAAAAWLSPITLVCIVAARAAAIVKGKAADPQPAALFLFLVVAALRHRNVLLADGEWIGLVACVAVCVVSESLPIPSLAVMWLLSHVIGGQLCRATIAFALFSPHFVVFYAAKTGVLVAGLAAGKQSSDEKHAGSAVLSSRLREMFLRLVVYCGSGRPVIVLRENSDDAKCVKLLTENVDKGMGLERFVSMAAWHPIMPTESIDGPQQASQRAAVIQVLANCRANVEQLIDQHMSDVTVLDSAALHLLLARVLHEFVFGESADSECAATWVAASISFRARIVMKASGDAAVQAKAIALCERLIESNAVLNALLINLSNAIEKVSVVLQPFILSPLINFSDAMVAVAHVMERGKDYSSKEEARALVMLALASFPPFPIQERVVRAPIEGLQCGAHVFVMADEMSEPHNWKAFGLGPRSCPGKSLAMTVLISVIRSAEKQGKSLGHVAEGHRYSGRLHDGRDESAVYFASALARLLCDAAGCLVRRHLPSWGQLH